MKNTSPPLYLLPFLISLIGFSSAKVNAQTYYFMNDSASWKVDFYGYTIECFGHCYEWEYFISGDTIINSNSFKKIRMNYHSIWNQQYSSKNVGAIREDVANKKVYFRSFYNDTTQYLLYDFDLNVGDTFPSTYLYEEGPFPVVDSIDYIQIANESHKRCWFTSESIQPVYLLEGVGSVYGLLENLYGNFEGANELTCFEVGDVLLFSAFDTSSTGCHVEIPLSTQNTNNPASIQINNNLNEGLLTITNLRGDKISISIFDELGRQCFFQSVSEDKFQLRTSSLAAGIYFIHCGNADYHTLLAQKILIR